MALKDYFSKTKKTKDESDLREKTIRSFFGGKDIFSTFVRSKVSKKDSSTKSSKESQGESASINQDSLGFLKIIAQNSISLPGMARDVNVLRQNVVKLVKLKAKETSTKADKFFKTEEQREAELEATRKKQEAKAVAVDKDGKPKTAMKAAAGDEGGGILSAIWGAIKKLGTLIFFGLMAAIGSAITFGSDIATWFEKSFKPMEWVESFFNSIKEGWKKITETDIVKETLIKGVGSFLDFITGGLFGEKELRESLNKLSEELKPIITFFTEMFDRVVNWMSDNIGWDKFTIPLSKASFDIKVPDWVPGLGGKTQKIGLSDITIPGFRPFKKRARPDATTPPSAPSSSPTPETPPAPVTSGLSNEQAQAARQSFAENDPRRNDRQEQVEPVNTKTDAIKLLEKFGVKPDPKSMSGFSDMKGNPIEEPNLRAELNARGVDGDRIINLIKSSPTQESKDPIARQLGLNISGKEPESSPSAPSLPPAKDLSSGTQPSSSAGPVSPSPEDGVPPRTSGSSLGQLSSDVAEGQRMDSGPDMGNIVNSSTVNNNKGTLAGGDSKIADAYNSSFIDSYFKTA
jgi:hypothetical protein